MTSPPDFIAITGDLTDQMAEPVDTSEGSVFDALRKLLDAATVPVEPVLGNHDYYAVGSAIFAITEDKPTRTQLFQDELAIPPFRNVEYGGMNFVFLNSMLGDECNDDLGLNGSLGPEQMTWLEDLLSDGVPAILFLHHPPQSVQDVGGVTLEDLIREHSDHILAVFAGHIHVWGRADIDSVPIYLTKEGFHGESFHHVQVDPEAGTVTILNEEFVDYGETVEIPCEPAETTAPAEPAGLEGRVSIVRMDHCEVAPMGLGTYLREVVPMFPVAFQFVEADLDAGTVTGYLALGKNSGDGADGAPPYMTTDGGPCVQLDGTLEGACFTTAPVDALVDIGPLLGVPLPWPLRAELVDLTLTGVLTDEGDVENGVFRSTIDFHQGSDDLKDIIISQYCAKRITDCRPGEDGRPACPDTVTTAFFDDIPVECDVELVGVGLRSIFAMFETVPNLQVDIDANFEAYEALPSTDKNPGYYAPALFAVEPDGACPAL